MKNLFLFFVAASLFFAAPAYSQVGKDSGFWEFTEPTKDYHKSSVLIKSSIGSGTGILIEGDYIVTAKHVVDEVQDDSIVVFIKGHGSFKAKLVASTRGYISDISVLKALEPIPAEVARIKVGDTPEIGDEVEIVGYGLTRDISERVRSWKSKVKHFNHTEDNMWLDTYAIPGDSGGAIINANGELVGVLSGGSFWVNQTIKGYYNPTWPVRTTSIDELKKLLESLS